MQQAQQLGLASAGGPDTPDTVLLGALVVLQEDGIFDMVLRVLYSTTARQLDSLTARQLDSLTVGPPHCNSQTVGSLEEAQRLANSSDGRFIVCTSTRALRICSEALRESTRVVLRVDVVVPSLHRGYRIYVRGDCE